MQSIGMTHYYEKIGESCEQDEQRNADTMNKKSDAETPAGIQIASIEAWGLDCQTKAGSKTFAACHCGKRLKLIDGPSPRYLDSDDENFSDDKENVPSHNYQKCKRSKENDKKQLLSLPTTLNSSLKIGEIRSHSFPLMSYGSNVSGKPDQRSRDCPNKDKKKVKHSERTTKKVFSPVATDFYSSVCKSEAFFGWQEETDDTNEGVNNVQSPDPRGEEDFSSGKPIGRLNRFGDNSDDDGATIFADMESSLVDTPSIHSSTVFHEIEVTLFDDLINPFDEDIDC